MGDSRTMRAAAILAVDSRWPAACLRFFDFSSSYLSTQNRSRDTFSISFPHLIQIFAITTAKYILIIVIVIVTITTTTTPTTSTTTPEDEDENW